MAGMKTLIIIFVIMFPVAMITEEDVNHGVCPVPMNKEEEEFIKERERNRELMEEIAREIEMTCSDECETGLHNCHNDAYCTNTKHSFTCTCKAGYTGDGVNCADINECNTGEHNCDVTGWCYNTIGSFGCACKEGYFKNGEDKCTDINECETGKLNCDANANCLNTKGSFVCTCKPGYSGNGVDCTDENECITGEHNCHAAADCNNTEGSFECTCRPGYSGNGVDCTACNISADVAFIVDSSGSIGRRRWPLVLDFLKKVINEFNIGPDGTHVAVVAYSTNANLEFPFNAVSGDEITAEEYGKRIDSIRFQRGFTYIDKALKLANEQVFVASAGMRSDVPKIAIVITDGEQTTTGGFTPLDEASKDMKDKGVVVYSLGVGSGVNSVQLRQIASSDDNVLTSTGFKKLTDLVYPIVEKSCLIKLTPTPTPSKK